MYAAHDRADIVSAASLTNLCSRGGDLERLRHDSILAIVRQRALREERDLYDARCELLEVIS
jgi:hypothetical protein